MSKRYRTEKQDPKFTKVDLIRESLLTSPFTTLRIRWMEWDPRIPSTPDLRRGQCLAYSPLAFQEQEHWRKREGYRSQDNGNSSMPRAPAPVSRVVFDAGSSRKEAPMPLRQTDSAAWNVHLTCTAWLRSDSLCFMSLESLAEKFFHGLGYSN